MGFVGFPGQAGRYVSGLCVATLGLCAAGWLALAPVAFGYRWVVAWRRRLRADGILARASRRQARRETRAQRRRERDGEGAARTPDPAQVLSELRALLTPLLPESAEPRRASQVGRTGRA